MKWVNRYDGGPHEANFLKLDCAKLKTTFGWKPHWNLDTAIESCRMEQVLAVRRRCSRVHGRRNHGIFVGRRIRWRM